MASDVLISPSVLNADLSRLHAEVATIASVADMIHLDVMDNHFVPNLTFGLPVVESLVKSSDIRADCHLMIDDPDRWAPPYARAGAYSVTFHVEAARDPVRVCADIRAGGARAGVAVKPGTDISAIDALDDSLDMILVMTVEPGFGGQSFMESMMPKVREAREWIREKGLDETWIQVDGGISLSTIRTAFDAGADTFVAGSAVYKSGDPAGMIRALRDAVTVK